MFTRERTRALKVGKVPVGGGAPVSVQTMGNADPHDAAACLAQLKRCAEAGCDVFRMTVPDAAAAAVFGEVRASSPVPIVADVHFDYRCALAALAAGADGLRINPGNIGSRDRVREVARAAGAKGVPIRIGVNGGSLEKGETLVSSALKHLALLEGEGFRDVVISAKASDVAGTVAAYRELAERTDCPLHLGVTEAGTLIPGAVRSSVALGALLGEGVGDTIRVSLTARPETEVKVGLEILRSLGMRPRGPAVTSCPTCGRTRVGLERVAERVEEALEGLYRARGGSGVFPKVAVMGCAVNGPGEAQGADVALCGGDGEFLLFVRGRAVGKVKEDEAVRKVVESVVSLQ
ncbi:MAG: flavodoxin-dependent (E)-4-hydroxy-3-methylbut-2-enyl-diphosphate synthase [Kiritimatiellae bacterium]|nr:flavodoxin-dependent (E)-4-hydroxy-3-methylbut-2-enyl-diphosphate synthase [Kiritimatiellia bacterium]